MAGTEKFSCCQKYNVGYIIQFVVEYENTFSNPKGLRRKKSGSLGSSAVMDGRESLFDGRAIRFSHDGFMVKFGGEWMKTQRFYRLSSCWMGLIVGLLLISQSAGSLWAQGGTRGTIVVTVADPTGGLVPGAKLTLVDVKTKDARTGSTLESGLYTFSGLLSGTYTLTVEKTGFATQKYESVVVESARTTDLSVKLKVGATSFNVEVVAEASPVLETSANAIGSNFDTKSIDDLPIANRDASELVGLVSGASDGIYNGMRGAAETNTIDGVVSSPGRMKDGGNSVPVVMARTENIDEVVVQTDQLDLNQGYGQANMQAGYTTRRGGDKYHGRVYGDLTNSYFQAFGYWADWAIAQGYTTAAQVRSSSENHTFVWGPSVGGPIPIPRYKDKLFFFASFTRLTTPGSTTKTSLIPSKNLQNGIFTDAAGTPYNLFTLAKTVDLGSSIWYQPNTGMAHEMAVINQDIATDSNATIIPNTSDPANITNVGFAVPTNSTTYYPTFRVDYNATQNLRVNLAFNETNFQKPNDGGQRYPGTLDSAENTFSKSYTASLGVDYSINPHLINQLHGGYLYYYSGVKPVLGDSITQENLVEWDAPEGITGSAYQHAGSINFFYPQGSMSDNLVWQHGKHNVNAGGSWYREQDHYWNNPQGWKYIDMGMGGGDPAINAFSGTTMPDSNSNDQNNAQAYYAMWSGRLSDEYHSNVMDPATGTFVPGRPVWNEIQGAFGFWGQDSWRVTPSLTLNYGMRWDFTGDDYDKAGNYYTLSMADVWGPSGYMNQFNPGSFKAVNSDPSFTPRVHAYSPWYVSPQPSFAVAWNPTVKDGLLGKLLGGSATVIRAGYALRNYTMAEQDFYDYVKGSGVGISNNINAASVQPVGGVQPAGTFAPGAYAFDSVKNDGTNSPVIPDSVFFTDVSKVQPSYTESSLAFDYAQDYAIDGNIKQPYIQSWNLGIQRELGKGNALEVRYVGNKGVHEWLPIDANEVNVFENGFLKEFQQAQANLAANTDGGFEASNSATTMPIMTAAFGGDASQFYNGQLIYFLQNGKVGDFAAQLAGLNAGYFCNLASGMSAPCQNNAGITGGGNGPYPMNIFQANPYAPGIQANVLVSQGISDYHSVQVEFRQKNFHGANFNANYTFSKNSGIRAVTGGDSSYFLPVTLRNMHLSYSPTDTDVRQIFNLYGTYDLPIGRGKLLLGNANAFVDRLVGGWNVGTISKMQTGQPFMLTGGNHTFNDYTDGGVNLNNVTLKQLRKSIGIWNTAPYGGSYFINPKYTAAGSTYITPNTTPGTIGLRPWLWGPHAFTSDMSVSKMVPIKWGVKFTLQAAIYDVFNHTTWGTGLGAPSNLNSYQPGAYAGAMGNGFGVTTAAGGARGIVWRGNFDF